MPAALPSTIVNARERLLVACMVLFLTLPFVLPFNTLPVPSFYREWVAFVLGCALLLPVLAVTKDEFLRLPRAVVLPLGMGGLILIHALLGRVAYWQQSVIAVLYLVWSAALICAGSALWRHLGGERFSAVVAWGLLLAAVLSAIAGIVQIGGFATGGVVMPMTAPSVHGNMAQPNQFADLLYLGLFSLCLLAVTGRLNQVIAAAVALLLLVAAELSGSRSIWIYSLLGLALAWWSHYRAPSAPARAALIWTAVLPFAMIAVAVVSVLLLGESVPAGDGTTGHLTASERLLGYDAGVSHRKVIWEAAWRMFQGAPFAGVGFGAFAHQYLLVSGELPAGLPEQITDNAHNVLLHVMAEFGLPGLVLLVAVALAWAVPRLRQCVTVRGWWLLAVVGVIVVHSLAEYPLWYAYFLGVFSLLIGAGEESVRRAGAKWSSPAMIGSVAVLTVWLLASAFIDYRKVEKLGVASVAPDDRRALLMEVARESSTSLFGHTVELGLARTITLDPVALDAKLALNTRVLRAFPAPDVAFRQSALLALSGDLEAARQMWDLAASAFPTHALAVQQAISQQAAAGTTGLEPLVEYAASRRPLRQ